MNETEKLKNIFETVEVVDALTAPLTRSIRNLLELAAAAVGSREASVIISDGETSDYLRFLVAIGEVADKLQNVQIPLGKGIAGFVFSSGQPIVVADAERDQNFYVEVDRQTGYSTQTILATPLRYNGEIIGVLEFVNRIGEPPFAPFTPEEMDKAALYAEAIATLVDAHESASLLETLAAKTLASTESIDLTDFLQQLRASPAHRETLEIAFLVGKILEIGEVERKLCREILESILRYAKASESNSNFLNF